jgi:hypothetical protein
VEQVVQAAEFLEHPARQLPRPALGLAGDLDLHQGAEDVGLLLVDAGLFRRAGGEHDQREHRQNTEP